MSQWPTASAIIILEGERHGTPIPPGTVAVRDHHDGQYFTSIRSGRQWLSESEASITRWVDLTHDADAAPSQTTPSELDERIRNISILPFEGRNSVLWPSNECSLVDWDDEGSVAKAVSTAYIRCYNMSDKVARDAIDLDDVQVYDILREAARITGRISTPQDVDKYTAMLVRYWNDMG